MNKETTPGPATTEMYSDIKSKLTQQILRKQELTAKLNNIEDSIYERELDYLGESAYGNIVKGFESFSKTSGGGSNKRRFQYSEDDHIFSLSSANYIKLLAKRQGLSGSYAGAGKEDFDEYEDSVEPGSAVPSSAVAKTVEKESTSNNNTLSRKRKARIIED